MLRRARLAKHHPQRRAPKRHFQGRALRLGAGSHHALALDPGVTIEVADGRIEDVVADHELLAISLPLIVAGIVLSNI